MARLLTQAQYARKIKYSRARISQLVKAGVIQLKKGKIDPAQASDAIEANIDRSRRIKSELKSQRPASPQMELIPTGINIDRKNGTGSSRFNTDQQNGYASATQSLTAARRDHEVLKMQLTETQLKERRGQLVPKGEYIKMIIALGSATKLAFLNLPRRLAGTLKVLDDEKEIEALLRSEIRSIIHNLLEQPLHGKHKHSRPKNSKKRMGGHLEASRRDLHPGVG